MTTENDQPFHGREPDLLGQTVVLIGGCAGMGLETAIPDHDDDPRNIAETRKCLRDFIRLDQTTDTPRALFDAMIELYPDRANSGSLWGGATAAKSKAGNGSPSAATTEK